MTLLTQAAENAAPPSDAPVKRKRGRPRKADAQLESLPDAKAQRAEEQDEATLAEEGVNEQATAGEASAQGARGHASEEDPYEGPTIRGMSQQWSKREDDELMRLIERHGAKRWSYIASLMQGGRRGKQCRDRYLNHLRPGIIVGEWSVEEERILVEGHKALGTKWAALAKLLPGRPENAIKNHWHATLRCKWTKVTTEPWRLSALQRYQMSLRGVTEETETEEMPSTTGLSSPSAELPKPIGMERSARNSRYSREQRLEIEAGLAQVGQRIIAFKDDPVSLAAVSDEQPSADATQVEPTRVPLPIRKSWSKPSAMEMAVSEKSGKSDVGTTLAFDSMELPGKPTAIPRSSVTSNIAMSPFICVSEDIIDIAQCQSAVSGTGAPELSMLTSVAAGDGLSEVVRNNKSVEASIIHGGLENISRLMHSRWSLRRVALLVRLGEVKRGDIKMCVVVGADDSRDCINAAEFASYLIKNESFVDAKTVAEPAARRDLDNRLGGA